MEVSRHRENKRGKGVLGNSGQISSDDVGFKLEFLSEGSWSKSIFCFMSISAGLLDL